jgi:hypothetical protein
MNESKLQYKELVINEVESLIQKDLDQIITYSYEVVDYGFQDLGSVPSVSITA